MVFSQQEKYIQKDKLLRQ